MDEKYENPRLRALLLGSRNQLDWLWKLADQESGLHAARVEGVLKLIGAIDYALGIEPYTLDLDLSLDEGGKAAHSQPGSDDSLSGSSWSATAEDRVHESRPLDIGSNSAF